MYDLLVVGAGPYSLSIASHAAAAGLNVRVFGRPMASWRDHMPRGMFLKSEPWASNLSDPEARWRLDVYCAGRGVTARHGRPIPLDMFTEYGLWFARDAAPPVDERMVTRVAPSAGGFEATTEDGETLRGRTVALAVGVLPFVEIPSALRGLSPELVSHSSHHADLDRFQDRDVTVIGGGQAALETAALLAEQGSRVRVLVRADRLCWKEVPPPWERPWWESARAPHSGLGPGLAQLVLLRAAGPVPAARRADPGADRGHRPRPGRRLVGARAGGIQGGGAARPRGDGGPGHRGRGAPGHGGARRRDGHPGDRTRHRGDRVQGDPGAARAPGRRPAYDAGDGADGAPEVDRGFESSYPGLFLAGLVTAAGFGPAMRFVHGATFTAGTLVRGVRRRLRWGPAGWGIPAGRRQPAPDAVRG